VGIEYASVVDHPLDEVFAWHTRPGAMRRLVPPWQPMRVVKETESLADGTAILGLPAGLRWIARHDPAGYDPPYQFRDVLSSRGLMSLPPRVIGWWRHTHRYSDAGRGTTRVHDIVDTTVPAVALRSTFAYRHRQLAEDLAAHSDAAAVGARELTIAITGSSGLVGIALGAFLSTGGHRVIRLVRGEPTNGNERRWVPSEPAADLLDGVDAVIHLAGESIAGRFTEEHRRAIRDSRIGPTRRLAEVAASTGGRLTTFISASAIGFYGYDCGDTELDEDSPRGDGFLAEVVADWEAATAPASAAGVRVVLARTGLVLSKSGGLLSKLRPLFALGLGGRLAGGRQYMPWISLDDQIRALVFAIENTALAGPVNLTGPAPVTNSEFTAALGRATKRPTPWLVPGFALKTLLGEFAEEGLLGGQRAVPAALERAGFTFNHNTIGEALTYAMTRGPS